MQCVSLTVVIGPVLISSIALTHVSGVGRPPDLVHTVGVTAAVMPEQEQGKPRVELYRERQYLPNPRVPAGVGALIDVAAANVCLEVLVAAITGTGVGAVAVTAGRVLSTVGQGGP